MSADGGMKKKFRRSWRREGRRRLRSGEERKTFPSPLCLPLSPSSGDFHTKTCYASSPRYIFQCLRFCFTVIIATERISLSSFLSLPPFLVLSVCLECICLCVHPPSGGEVATVLRSTVHLLLFSFFLSLSLALSSFFTLQLTTSCSLLSAFSFVCGCKDSSLVCQIWFLFSCSGCAWEGPRSLLASR